MKVYLNKFNLIKRIIYFTIWFLDILIAIGFLFFNVIMLKLGWLFLKKQQTILNKEANLKRNKNRTLFIGSGKPIQYPNFSDPEYKKQWHKFFQKQLLHPTYDLTYIYYTESDKKKIYKLTKNVITLVLPKPVRYVFLKKTTATFNLLYSLVICLKLIYTKRINVIEAFAPCDQLFFVSILEYITKTKIVAQVMGDYDLSSYSEDSIKDNLKKYLCRQLDKFILSLFFGASSLVLACNKHCATFALCNGAHPAKIRLQRYTPTLDKIENYEILPKEKLLDFPKNTTKNIILWSRFAPEKKLKYGIKGALKVLEKHHDVGLILVGYGPMYDEIANLVNAHIAKDRILLKSFTPFHELISYISNSDIALIPLGGYALVEAAHLRKPIVAFDLEWHHELLINDYSGYLADYPEYEEIYKKIVEILNNPEKASIAAENAYKQSQILFDAERNENKEKIIMQKFRKSENDYTVATHEAMNEMLTNFKET